MSFLPRSSLQCLIHRRGITTTARLCNINNSNNSNSTFISRSSTTAESKSNQSSNRFQNQFNNSGNSSHQHQPQHRNRQSPRLSHHHHHHKGHRDGFSKSRHKNTNDDASKQFNLQKILDTGSESAQNALKSILSRIHNLQPLKQQVQYVSPTQGLITCSIQQVLEGLDLSSQGLQLIEKEVSSNNSNSNANATAPSSPTIVPLVKRIKIQEMLKSYNDELAEAKELELLNMGSKKTIRALDNKLRAKQKKSSEKQIMIKWSININDLQNQKQLEIENRLKKEKTKIVIYLIHNKHSPNLKIADLYRNAMKHDASDDIDEVLDIELKKRTRVKQTLDDILNSLDCKWTSEGDVESKVVYTIMPSAATVGTADGDKVKLNSNSIDQQQSPNKNKKKQKAKGSNEKQVLQKTKSKVDQEQDLDALYSFKIED
ncbi:AIM23 [Candida margitis]|uniref:AIM23 n=1 Tax=Candida margitis TaxID=1775924 RepID=UPI002226CE1D|nr:AIM23 [Candida margitis]KAI5950604.1 AIM23 [Candida margitis]